MSLLLDWDFLLVYDCVHVSLHWTDIEQALTQIRSTFDAILFGFLTIPVVDGDRVALWFLVLAVELWLEAVPIHDLAFVLCLAVISQRLSDVWCVVGLANHFRLSSLPARGLV